MPTAFRFLAAFCLVLPLAACSCEDDGPPPGEPYMCPDGMMAGGTLCRTGEACIEAMGGMTGFSCAPERGCPLDSKALYCPRASGSVFCTADQEFPLVTPPDGGPATTRQSRVLCQW
jgi:hypothetical protein